MSGILRNLCCLCFVGLMVGSLWLFAASATVPSIPPWCEKDQEQFTTQRPPNAQFQQTAAVDHELDVDVDDVTATAAAVSFDDEDVDNVRRT